MTDTSFIRQRVPIWVWAAAAFGVAWNIFGLVQLADFVMQTRASLMMKGMTPAAAELYYGLPIWMKLTFAVGSAGGLVGSIALAARRQLAVPVFVTSLAGYVALYVGDLVHGVFAVIPGQMAILTIVVAIAAGLLVTGLIARRRDLLD